MPEPRSYIIEFELWVFEVTVTPSLGRANIAAVNLCGRHIYRRNWERIWRHLKTLATGYYQAEMGVQS